MLILNILFTKQYYLFSFEIIIHPEILVSRKSWFRFNKWPLNLWTLASLSLTLAFCARPGLGV